MRPDCTSHKRKCLLTPYSLIILLKRVRDVCIGLRASCRSKRRRSLTMRMLPFSLSFCSIYILPSPGHSADIEKEAVPWWLLPRLCHGLLFLIDHDYVATP
jgi:hypothetical protein